MGALDRFLRRGRLQDGGYKPLMKRLEAAMLAACRAAGASAWYVSDSISGVYQDSTGATPGAVGSIVGRINDQAGSINISHATAGNRPLLSRLPRKIGANIVSNGDFSADLTGWTSVSGDTGTAVTGGRLVVNRESTGGTWGLVTTEIGKTYWLEATVKAGTSAAAVRAAADTYNGNVLADSISVTGATKDSKLGFAFTATSTTSAIYLRVTGAGGTAEFDNISVREVVEWSNVLLLDGSNDTLSAAVSVVGANLNQPYTLISWGRTGTISGATRILIGDGARILQWSSTGTIDVLNRGRSPVQSTTQFISGQTFVVEGTWDGATHVLMVNGVQETSAASSTALSGAVGTSLGNRGDAAQYWLGEIGGAVVCPAVMTDDQRLAVRKFAAAQMGMTL